jgi:NAD+ kinase
MTLRMMFLASPKPAAQRALQQLTDQYGQSDLIGADCVVPIGGDGIALHTVLNGPPKPVFAMRHEGSVGFLANAVQVDDLPKRIQAATSIQLSLPCEQIVRISPDRSEQRSGSMRLS